MKEDKIADYFKQKLTGHQCDVPDELWCKVEANLPPVQPFHTRRRYYYLAAAAFAALVIGVAFFLSIEQETTPLQEASGMTEVADLQTLQIPVEENTPQVKEAIQSEQPVVGKGKLYAEVMPVAVDESQDNAGQSSYMEAQSVIPVVQSGDEATCCDEQMLSLITDEPDKVVLPEMEIADSALYDYDALAVVINSAGKPILPGRWLSVKANAMRADVVPVQYVMRAGTEEILYRHKMPLSVTASFEKRWGRWGVGTGVSYTFMSSDYEMADRERLGTQRLHYLGVPLYVSFNIAKVKRFSFYASAGGEADFNIAGIQKESKESLAYETLKEKKVRDKKPQLSVQARVGAAFTLMSHLDLYIEPTLGYYFHHESPVHSVWNDRPWNVSLSLAVRTGF